MRSMCYVKNSMNMKDNTDRLLEAADHPDRFSDRELESLLADPTARELYDTMVKAANLLTPSPEPDIDAEWARFAAKHRKGAILSRRYLLPRHAAAAVIAVVLTFAVVAATVGITRSLTTPTVAENTAPEPTATIQKAIDIEETPTPTPEIKVFRNRTLEEIITVISDYYGATAKFTTDDSKNLRLYFKWNQSEPLSEVVEQLNSFEQIDISLADNLLTVE